MSLILFSSDEPGFWSNDQGWVNEASNATQFTSAEAQVFSKPAGSIWIEYDESLVFDEEGALRKILGDGEATDAAREQYHSAGECEIDQYVDPKELVRATSRGDEMGCYVKAWVWVYWPHVDEPEEVKP